MKIGFLICLAVLPCLGQTSAYVPPKTSDGLPDLEGMWQPRANGAAYSILPHPGGFFLGAE